MFNKKHYNTTRTAIIDADSFAFKYGNIEDKDEIKEKLIERLNDMLIASNCDSYVGFIGRGNSTFRHKLFDDYKANRKDKQIPTNVAYVKQLIESIKGFYVVKDMEAEDAVGILSNKIPDAMICHIDSDLKQLEGYHYDYDKNIQYRITKEEANLYYWTMVITGSHKDNVKGLYRFKQSDIDYSDCITYRDYYNKCFKIYKDYIESKISNYLPNINLNGYIESHFKQQCRLQHIRRNANPSIWSKWAIASSNDLKLD